MASDPLSPSGENLNASNEPVPPSPLSTGVTGLTSPAGATDSGLTPNVAAGLAVVFTLLGGIVFLLVEKRNAFVRFWAMQAVFFGVAIFVYSILSSIIGSVLGHILTLLAILWGLFSLLVFLGFLAVWVFMLVKAFGGQEWEAPFIGKLARQQLVKPPLG